jgi:hypothetical protein
MAVLTSYRLVFIGRSILCLVVTGIYLCLSSAVEVDGPRAATSPKIEISAACKTGRQKDHGIVVTGRFRQRFSDRRPSCVLVLPASELRNKNWVSFSLQCIAAPAPAHGRLTQETERRGQRGASREYPEDHRRYKLQQTRALRFLDNFFIGRHFQGLFHINKLHIHFVGTPK